MLLPPPCRDKFSYAPRLCDAGSWAMLTDVAEVVADEIWGVPAGLDATDEFGLAARIIDCNCL